MLTRRKKMQNLVILCRSLSTFLGSGMGYLESLEQTGNLLPSQSYREAMSAVREEVAMGQPMAVALSHYPEFFPTSLVNLVSHGEECGNVERNLDYIADQYQEQLDLERKTPTVRYLATIFACGALFQIFALVTMSYLVNKNRK